jgi:four helix bundle protein
MAHAFRDLQVWQRSMQLAKVVYCLTKEFPPDERFGLTSQIRRSAVSIPSNIAEGQGRSSLGEFKQFLGIARGSNYELQTQRELAKAFGFAGCQSIENTESLSHEVGKMLYALIDSLKTNSKLISEN